MQRATSSSVSRAFFNSSRDRSVEQVLSLFSANREAMTPFIAGAMMRNLGVALRQKRPENRLNISDPRFVDLIEYQKLAISGTSSGAVLTAIAEGFATFPSNEEAVASLLAPLADRTAEAVVRVIGNLSPDQLSVLVRALSFRGAAVFGEELRKLVAQEISSKIDSLAHHNVREIMQAMRMWPIDGESARLGNLLLRRLRNSLATISGADALKLLVVLQKGPNYLRTTRGDLKPRLLEMASREFDNFSLANKMTFLEICSENRPLLSEEQTKATTKRLATVVSEISGPEISSWLKTVAVLRMRLNDFDAVARKFVDERMPQASFREKVDAMWAVGRLRGAEDGNFLEILSKAIRPDSQLRMDDDPERLFELLDILALVGIGKFPIMWAATLANAESERVNIELRSKSGNFIERNLPAGKFAKNVAIGNSAASGIYRAPFFNAEEKIAIDLEPKNFRLHFNLRQKILQDQFGVKLVIIPDGALLAGNRRADISDQDLVNSFLARAAPRV